MNAADILSYLERWRMYTALYVPISLVRFDFLMMEMKCGLGADHKGTDLRLLPLLIIKVSNNF